MIHALVSIFHWTVSLRVSVTYHLSEDKEQGLVCSVLFTKTDVYTEGMSLIPPSKNLFMSSLIKSSLNFTSCYSDNEAWQKQVTVKEVGCSSWPQPDRIREDEDMYACAQTKFSTPKQCGISFLRNGDAQSRQVYPP